jgi:hypothetical protein
MVDNYGKSKEAAKVGYSTFITKAPSLETS